MFQSLARLFTGSTQRAAVKPSSHPQLIDDTKGRELAELVAETVLLYCEKTGIELPKDESAY